MQSIYYIGHTFWNYIERATKRIDKTQIRKFHGHSKNDEFVLYEYIITQFGRLQDFAPNTKGLLGVLSDPHRPQP